MKVLEVTEQDWDAIHDVNLKAVFFSCQAAAKLMLRNGGGKIVNISSLGGLRPWTRHVPYCTSKAGVVMLTEALAKALAPEIAVNGVAPGVIHFGPEMPALTQRLISVTPMRRPGSGEEIAETVLHFNCLRLPRARYQRCRQLGLQQRGKWHDYSTTIACSAE